MDRRQLVSSFSATDEAVELATKVLRSNAIMDDSELLPAVNDYLTSGISLFHLKFAYLLLLSHRDERTLTRPLSILDMTPKIFVDRISTWNDFFIGCPKSSRSHISPNN
jgi:hypothetical protein